MSEATVPNPFSLESSSGALTLPVGSAATVTHARPVSRRERIPTIDVVRGVALLGILLMNIGSFSGPYEMYVNPLIVGDHRAANLVAWSLRWVLFEGKMRAAFSMLFGAGVILLTERAERNGTKDIADIFLRRNMWLVLFGVLHFYFIWSGDILYAYGLTALVFLYPCRKVRVRNLLIAGAAVLLIGAGSDTYFSWDAIHTRNQAKAALAAQQAGQKLTAAQQETIKKWNDVLDKRKKNHDDDLKAMRGSYLAQLKWRAQSGPRIQAKYYYTFGFADVLGMMLLGMGLYKMGFLTSRLPNRAYGWTIAIGILLSVPISGFQARGLIRDNFQDESAWWALYQFGRATGAIACVALVVLVCKAGVLRWLTHRLAAVGQTALSNYLLTSISCSLLFNGFGARLYGELEYYQLFAVVLCMWTVNLVVSPIWLQHFQFGPMEWVWRSLTYWERQPMRLRTAEEPEPVAVTA